MNRVSSSEAVDLSDGAIQTGLTAFLSKVNGHTVAIEDFSRCSSGFSWMTFSFRARIGSDEGQDLILQVGPHTGLLAPYSVLPQVLCLQALAGGSVPVAGVVAYSNDDDALGAPFLVCRKVGGEVIVPWGMTQRSAAERLGLAERMVGILADLHRADAPTGALSPLQPDLNVQTATTAQIDHWVHRIEEWRTKSYPILTWAGHWFRRNAPEAPRVCIVHSDFRLGNFLSQGAEITAVLDWEMVHLGHPLEDLGWLVLPMYNGGSRDLFGTLPRREAIARYSARSGIPVDNDTLRYFECFAMFKSIVITMAGMHAYACRGSDDMRMLTIGTRVESLIRQLDKMIGAGK